MITLQIDTAGLEGVCGVIVHAWLTFRRKWTVPAEITAARCTGYIRCCVRMGCCISLVEALGEGLCPPNLSHDTGMSYCFSA